VRRSRVRLAFLGFAGAVAFAATGCGEEDLGGAPDVRGLSLPSAEKELKQAGYSPDVQTDAAFGVIVESNFTVCSQEAPKGQLVPIDVSNDNCE
jgi:hypothetical protein